MAVSTTFNVGDLSPYIEDEIYFGDSRTNPLKGGEDDADEGSVQDTLPEPKKGLMLIHEPFSLCEAM